MKKQYKAFTLVEMLIVMGIIIILMAVGIASGRFAIRRANRIEHENAAEQLYQAAQSYYSDNREYPPDNTPEDLIVGISGPPADSLLSEYIDDFDGGSEATYFYDADSTGQVMIVCVTLGGALDANDLGVYCTGNGINAPAGTSELIAITEKEFDSSDATNYAALGLDDGSLEGSNSEWDPADPWGSE